MQYQEDAQAVTRDIPLLIANVLLAPQKTPTVKPSMEMFVNNAIQLFILMLTNKNVSK